MTYTTKAIAALSIVAGLGIAALPLGGAHAAKVIDGTAPAEGAVEGATYDGTADGKVQTNTEVELVISDILSIETGADKVTLESTDGTNYTANPLTVTVTTKNSKGYSLSIKGSATDNPTSLTNGSGDQILKAAGTFAAPAALSNATNSEWGYKAGEMTDYAGVTETDQVIKTSNAATVNSGEATDVTFGAIIKDGQAAGTYTGQVTFTATNNPNTATPEGA